MSKMCVMTDVRYCVLDENSVEVYRVISTGETSGEPISVAENDESSGMFYRCYNCGRQRKKFDEMRLHLGKFNELVDPFNYPKKENPP